MNKKILLGIIVISILLFISIDKAFTFDYTSATRQQLLERCLHFAKELRKEQVAHRETKLELKTAYQDLDTLQSRVYYLQNNIRNILQLGTKIQAELDQRTAYPYQPGEVMFSFSIGIGTSINLGVESRIYIYQGLYGYLSVDGFYGQYWDFQNYPYALALGGLGWSF